MLARKRCGTAISGPGTNIIDVQISRLRNKMGRGYSPALLHTLRGSGYTIKADA